MQSLKVATLFLLLGFFTGAANAQIEVQLKFSRLQYIAYEPLLATVTITNRAGRDIDLRDDGGERWFGFEITGGDGQSVPEDSSQKMEPLHIETGQTVTQKINLVDLYPIEDFGNYHIRAHVYFSDLGRYFYSQTKVVEVTDARPIWKQSVGIPADSGAGGDSRTYSLLTNRFADHTSLYVRVEDEHRNTVYATYSLGHARTGATRNSGNTPRPAESPARSLGALARVPRCLWRRPGDRQRSYTATNTFATNGPKPSRNQGQA